VILALVIIQQPWRELSKVKEVYAPFLYVFVINLFLGLSVNAQSTTADITADFERSLEQDSSCSPSTYTFTLHSALTCTPTNVTRNGGISSTVCQISPFRDADSNITYLVPVEVAYVNVFELGRSVEVLKQDNITGTFKDSATIDYTSIFAGVVQVTMKFVCIQCRRITNC
jgi:hypothetical protein